MSENTPGRSEGQPEQPKFVPAAPPVAPAGNAYAGYVPTKLPAGLAIASLVLGIVSIVGAIPLSFVTIVVALVGLILGIIALRKVPAVVREWLSVVLLLVLSALYYQPWFLSLLLSP